jgi:phenylalanyl-tRNA synthetase beta chain
VNYSFVEEAWENDFVANANPIRLLNPIASQMSVMRSSLIGSLIANVRYNLNRKINRVRLFEIGAVFLRNPDTQDGPLSVAGYDQPKRVSAITYGPAVEEQWGQPTRNVDYFDIKADMEALFAPQPVHFTKMEHPALHPGRAAQISLNGKAIGFIGELHPRWQQKYELPLAPVMFEVEADALQMRDLPAYQEISKFPAVTRDLAFVVQQSVTVQDLLDTFFAEKETNPVCHIMQAIVLFDEYRGKGLENNEKSLAFRITLQDTQSTLHDDTVNAAIAAFTSAVNKKHGGKLRS